MTMEEDTIDALDTALDRFISDLGSMRGFNDDAYKQVCAALKSLAQMWAHKEHVPRRAVASILGVVDIMLNVRERYDTATVQLLEDGSAELDELIGACFVDRRP